MLFFFNLADEFPSGFIPVCSLGMSQIGQMNLGKDASTFKYYTMCGLQEGFEPFAVNMKREITMWFSKRLPTFVNIPQDHPHIEVKRQVGLWLHVDEMSSLGTLIPDVFLSGLVR